MSEQIDRMRAIHTRMAIHHGKMAALFYALLQEVREYNPANVGSQYWYMEAMSMHSRLSLRSRIAAVDLRHELA